MKELDIFYEPPIELRRKHKDVCYTVTPIGGPEELKAWKEEQGLKRQARQKALAEAYALNRHFYADIVAGRAEPSSDALKDSPTLARFKQEHGAPCPSKPTQPSNYEVAVMLPQAPKWYQRMWNAVFK